MSKVKRFLAILVAAIMTLGMTVSAFAGTAASPDGKFGTSGDTGKITVSGIEKETGVNFKVKYYKVIEAQYQNNGSFSGYNSLYSSIIPNPVAENLTITSDQLNELADAAASKQADGEMSYNDDSKLYTATVAPGSYLVLVSGTESKSYNPMVVSVSYERKTDGTTGLKEDTLTLVEGTATAKKSGMPEVTKKIVDDTVGVGMTDKGNSAEIGEDVNYEISVKPIPNYNGSYPVLNVVDTLDNGLQYNADLKVYIKDGSNKTELSADKYSSTTPSSQEIKVDFVVENSYTLNEYAGKEIVITYSAKVKNTATLNDIANKNTVTLNYSKDSKTEGEGNNGTDIDRTNTYTFEIDGENSGTVGIITKTGDRTEDKKGLDGATFALYKTRTDAENDTTNTRFKEATTSTINGTKGQLQFTGLEAGQTYYLRELTAPAGYSVNTHIFEVKIEATYDNTVGSATYGQLTNWIVKVDNNPIAKFTLDNGTFVKSDNYHGVDILNTKISSLPSTGGIGTTIFTIGGCAIMIVAAGLFFATRRKTQK